jgi:hypothetical protein
LKALKEVGDCGTVAKKSNFAAGNFPVTVHRAGGFLSATRQAKKASGKQLIAVDSYDQVVKRNRRSRPGK